MVRPRDTSGESHQMRGLLRDIRSYLEAFTASIDLVSAKTSRKTGGGIIAWTRQGKLIGQFERPELVDYLRRSPAWLLQMMAHIELLERAAYEQRVENRRMAAVANALSQAHNVGVTTPVGRRHLDEAIDALFTRDDRFS